MPPSRSWSLGARPRTIPDGLEPVPDTNYRETVFHLHYAEDPTAPTTTKKGLLEKLPILRNKTICGMRRSRFIFLALIILIAIAASVAGGVGGSMAVSDAYDRGQDDLEEADGSDLSTQDDDDDDHGSSGPRIKPPPETGMLELDCPALTGTAQEINVGLTKAVFRASCGVRHPAPHAAIDLARLPAYRFTDCLTACAAYNDFGAANKTCDTVHFNANLQNEAGGNCWLKSRIGEGEKIENEDKKNEEVEAYLEDEVQDNIDHEVEDETEND